MICVDCKVTAVSLAFFTLNFIVLFCIEYLPVFLTFFTGILCSKFANKWLQKISSRQARRYTTLLNLVKFRISEL